MDILELKKKYLKYLGLTINYTLQVKRLVLETGQKELYLNDSNAVDRSPCNGNRVTTLLYVRNDLSIGVGPFETVI